MTDEPQPQEKDISRKTFALIILVSALIVSGSMIFSMLALTNSLTGAVVRGGSALAPSGNQPTAVQAPRQAPQQQGPVAAPKIDFANKQGVIGDKNSKVVLVEYSDFQCPFCGRYFTQTYNQLKRDYIDTGKIVYYFADFPLEQIHEGARPYANAGRCAGEQGKFWEMHDKMFVEQHKDNPGTVPYVGDATVKKWAQEIGLDAGKFNSCFDSKKYDQKIAADQQEGVSNGVSGTPSFFVNGKQLVGAQPYEVFKQAIDAALASA